jgi:hypothetical protein
MSEAMAQKWLLLKNKCMGEEQFRTVGGRNVDRRGKQKGNVK